MTVHLRSISPDATPEEVAAILAAVSALNAARRPVVVEEPEPRSRWVHLSRLRAARATYQRGEWRLSGRMARKLRS